MRKEITGICPTCGMTFMHELESVLKMALLMHVSHSPRCAVESPTQIDKMVKGVS